MNCAFGKVYLWNKRPIWCCMEAQSLAVFFRLINIWDKVFKNGPSKICGWQALSRPYPFNCFKDCLLQILFHPFFWILCVNYIYNYWIIVLHCPATLRWKVRINLFRSSHRRCSVKNGVLRNFAKLTGKRLC